MGSSAAEVFQLSNEFSCEGNFNNTEQEIGNNVHKYTNHSNNFDEIPLELNEDYDEELDKESLAVVEGEDPMNGEESENLGISAVKEFQPNKELRTGGNNFNEIPFEYDEQLDKEILGGITTTISKITSSNARLPPICIRLNIR